MPKSAALKYWPLAVLTVLIVAIVCMSRYAENRKASKATNTQPSSPQISVAPNDASKTPKNTDKPKNPPSWVETFAWPDGVIARVLILTLIVIAWQSVETCAAAKAGKVAAEAARFNVQAVVNAERALLLFTVEKERVEGTGMPAIFHINVVNYGKVPARRLEISNPFHATMTLADFISVSPPDYGEDFQEIQEWLAPKESWRVATFSPYENRVERVMVAHDHGVKPHMVEVIIYGQVTYYDGISSDVRHSRYCFAHDREPFSNIGGSLTPVGSEEYLECT